MMNLTRRGHSTSMTLAGTLHDALPTRVDSPGESASGATRQVHSFDEIYAEYFDFVWRSVRRLGVAEAGIDDAVQDVFLVLHRRLPEFEGRSSVKTWIFGIALRVARDHRRLLRRKGLHEHLNETIADETRGPLESAEQSEAARFVERFLASLDADKRAVFILADLEDMTAPEIAETLAVNVNTVYSRIRAARAAFESELARHQRRHHR